MHSKIDWPTFATCVLIILLVCLPLTLAPEQSGSFVEGLYGYISNELGVVYLLAGTACITFLVWLASSRFGEVTLGTPGEPPEFSRTSWIAMLFCAGVGGGLMYWSGIEWAFYYPSPPFGAEPRSPEAAEWAATYGLFHWGMSAWAFYCLPTLAIAYPYYSKKLTHLRFSSSCHSFLDGHDEGPIGRAIDLVSMLALIGGAAVSLGLSSPMVAACIASLTGLTATLALEFSVVLLCIAIFATSVWLGLHKGIERLSDLNLILALGLLAFVLVAGPTVFIVKTSLNSVGLLAQNFIRMNFWTDPITDSGFVERWTIFYWAWWISFAPYIGLFGARISRGRTIREVIVGMLLYGSLGSWAFYMVIGNFSLFVELEGLADITGRVGTENTSGAIVTMLSQLPFASLATALFAVVAIIFAATTFDSASYCLASVATMRLRAGDDPARWHRVFWALALGALPATFMFVGGFTVLQTTVLVVSLPILVVGVVMAISLTRSLLSQEAAASRPA